MLLHLVTGDVTETLTKSCKIYLDTGDKEKRIQCFNLIYNQTNIQKKRKKKKGEKVTREFYRFKDSNTFS